MALALSLVPYRRPERLPQPTVGERAALRASLVSASRKGAAAELGVSERAIRWRLELLYRRLGVLDRAQAVAWMDDHYPGWRERMPER
jgi:DNA-binding CsgD family transcriptional regulator